MRQKAHALTAIDLFCGCGGLTLGLKQAGFAVVAAVDLASLAVKTYVANHPEVHVWQLDIRRLSVSEVQNTVGLREGDLDLLAGCPPCQGFSRVRTLNGSRSVDDNRNTLVLEFLRFVEGLMPRTVMMENVPGLAQDARFSRLCGRVRELGYACEYRVLDAADYGVPQRRKRLMLLAGQQGPVGFARGGTRRTTVRDAIGSLPTAGQSGDPLHDLPERRSGRIGRLISMIPKDGGSREDLGPAHQLACHKTCSGFHDVYGRMAWDDVAPTITSGCVNPSKGRFLHPDEDRAMTLREAALLQTFPEDYHFSLDRGKYPAAALIGNAFPPQFVRFHAAKVQRYLLHKRGH